MQSAEEDRLLEVSFVSRVREEARVIELYDESDHVARLRLDQVVTVRTAARRNWSARCEGRTVAVWTVRGAGQLFEIPAGAWGECYETVQVLGQKTFYKLAKGAG